MESSRQEDLLLDKQALQQFDNECEDIYFFTQREISLIYSSLRYADWDSRWTDRDRDDELVETIKAKLLMLCARDLVKAQVATICALTGRSIDLSSDAAIEAFLLSNLNFSEDGITPAIDRLTSGGEDDPDYTDELVAIGTILGAVVV